MKKRTKGKSLTPSRTIKEFLWEMYGMIIPMPKRQFMRTPVTDSDRVTYYLNRGKYSNHKTT